MDIKAAVLPAYNKIRRLSFAVKSNRLLACEDFRSLDTLYRDSLLIAHSFEKALCIESCRDDFGTQKADRLLDYLTLAAKDPSFDNHSYAFVESMAALENWLSRRARLGLDCSKWQHGFESLAKQTSYEVGRTDMSDRSGIVSDSFASVSDCDKNAINFINGRHSVRSFDSTPVPQETLTQVVELAQSAPSACNRQPSRVYFPVQNLLMLFLLPCVAIKGLSNQFSNGPLLLLTLLCFPAPNMTNGLSTAVSISSPSFWP